MGQNIPIPSRGPRAYTVWPSCTSSLIASALHQPPFCSWVVPCGQSCLRDSAVPGPWPLKGCPLLLSQTFLDRLSLTYPCEASHLGACPHYCLPHHPVTPPCLLFASQSRYKLPGTGTLSRLLLHVLCLRTVDHTHVCGWMDLWTPTDLGSDSSSARY